MHELDVWMNTDPRIADKTWWYKKEIHVNTLLKRKWNSSSLEDFRQSARQDLVPPVLSAPGYVQYMSDVEKRSSIEAYETGTTNYAPDSFQYYLNRFGFRGHNEPGMEVDGLSMGFFGCSFTFGIGLPEEKHFVSMFGKHFNLNTFNFGCPGGGIGKTARLFSQISKFQKLDYAIFVLPHIQRLEYVVPSGMPNDKFRLTSLILNYSHVDPFEEAVRRNVKEILSDEYLLYDATESIMFIDTVAKLHNIKVFYTSWDMPTMNLILSLFDGEPDKILPWFQFREYKDTSEFKRGRDGVHPGDESSRLFVERCIPHLEKHINA